MSSMCEVTIIGRLTADPVQGIPESGLPYTRLRLAWNHNKKAGFIDATLFGRTGEVAFEYLVKGTQICLSGSRLEYRTYEAKDGSGPRVGYALVGGNLTMLGKKADIEEVEVPVKGKKKAPVVVAVEELISI